MKTPALAADADIQAVLQEIDADRMMADVERLVAFDNRFMGSDSNWAAVSWLKSRLEEMGYVVGLDSFQVDVNTRVLGKHFILSNLTQVNIVASRRGVVEPEKKVVLGAHYDSISLDFEQSEQGFAPGADDNASGVAGILEIARLFASIQTGMTVEFVLFGAEELGLVGSDAYAQKALDQGEEIVLMMGLDVIGTRSATLPDAFTLDTTTPSLSLVEQVADAAEDFTSVFSRDGSSNSRIMVSAVGCRCSDHQSFLSRGFPAVGVFQFFTNPSPHINMSTDTIENVDIVYAAEITKAILAGTLRLSGFPGRTPDFDGDGVVGFGDFLFFAEAFGMDVMDASDAVFDLDGDGAIAFPDFLIFAQSFGRAI